MAFAALEQEGAAGLEHDTGQWDLTAMWQQIHAALNVSLTFPMFSEIYTNSYDLFLSPEVITVPFIANDGL